jgi:hypothetical protein
MRKREPCVLSICMSRMCISLVRLALLLIAMYSFIHCSKSAHLNMTDHALEVVHSDALLCYFFPFAINEMQQCTTQWNTPLWHSNTCIDCFILQIIISYLSQLRQLEPFPSLPGASSYLSRNVIRRGTNVDVLESIILFYLRFHLILLYSWTLLCLSRFLIILRIPCSADIRATAVPIQGTVVLERAR